MTITVNLPFPGPIGPGLQINVQTDLQVTLPPTALWSVSVVPTRNEARALIGQSLSSDVVHVAGVLGSDELGWQVQGAPMIGAAEGESALLIVDLLNTVGEVVLDHITVPTTWSATTAAWTLPKTTGGGLTAEQAAQLTQVVTNTTTAAILPGPLGGLFQIPSIVQQLLNGTRFVIQGRNTVVPPQLAGLSIATGLVIHRVDAPAGFGLRDGFIQTFHDRVAQLVALTSSLIAGTDIVVDTFDVHADQTIWYFRNRAVQIVGYDVTPGCSVTVEWLLAQVT